ncbi:MAG: hypothetical protein H7Y86_02635, partial [Rhizobacter sp.]|nr:hypothetical protein [Ferruginibacter sp.]
MKNLIPFFAMLSLMACKKSTTDSFPINPVAFSLEVNLGFGSDSYKAGDSVFIFSNATATNQVFDKWVGDVSTLKNVNEWRTTLKMPSANITVTATYKTITPITFTSTIINGSQVYYYLPATYRGIILPFHGAGGSATGWTAANLENLEFCKYAAKNGYALVITESKDRVNKRWDATATSVDIANIDIILNTLQTSGVIVAGKPLYGVGMSQGSGFCSIITALKNYNAGALYCLGGIDQVFDQSTVPIIWNMAAKDLTEDPNRLVTAKANYDKLAARGIGSAFNINDPTPLYPARFTIAPNISITASTEIYNGLKAGGYLDAKGFLNFDPRVNNAWLGAIPPTYQTSAYIGDIEDQ